MDFENIDLGKYFQQVKNFISSIVSGDTPEKTESPQSKPISKEESEQDSKAIEELLAKKNKNTQKPLDTKQEKHEDTKPVGSEHAKHHDDKPKDKKPMGDEYAQSPVRDPDTASYGNYHPGVYLNEMHSKGHDGVDYGAPKGTPVYPIAPGIVTSTATGGEKSGNSINVRHQNGFVSFYAHLDTIDVKPKQEVTTSTQIGTIGNTGNASKGPPHLHFQIFDPSGKTVDPKTFLNIPKYVDPGKHVKQLQDRKKANKEKVNSLHKDAERFYVLNKIRSDV